MGKPGDGRTAPSDAGLRGGRQFPGKALGISGLVFGCFLVVVIALNSSQQDGHDLTDVVDHIVDADTMRLAGGEYLRLALIDAPEVDEPGGLQARDLIVSVCPAGSTVRVDLDEGQGSMDPQGRLLGAPYCNGYNLNEMLIDSGAAMVYKEFCHVSDFASEPWASECD